LSAIFLSGDEISFFNRKFCHFGEFSDKKPVLKDGVLGQPPRNYSGDFKAMILNGKIPYDEPKETEPLWIEKELTFFTK
jgi:hypothetical protein